MSADTDAAALKHLADLEAVLLTAGLRVTRASRDGHTPPHLSVSAGVPQLAEQIYCEPAEGDWWFWWSWAERIAPVTDAATALRKIHRVITPAHAQ